MLNTILSAVGLGSKPAAPSSPTTPTSPRSTWRQNGLQLIEFLMVVFAALIIWKGLMVVTGSESPIVVVLSGSMEPGFFKGDLMLLVRDDEAPLRAGQIPVFKLDNRDIPIVHRLISVFGNGKGDYAMMTKGDNNDVDDRMLYGSRPFIQRHHVVGVARASLPVVGMLTIVMNENPMLKLVLIGGLAVFFLLHRE